jgi:hypothetical protein
MNWSAVSQWMNKKKKCFGSSTVTATQLFICRLQKAKGKKLPPGVEPVSTILRGLEISLRTNTLSYVPARLCALVGGVYSGTALLPAHPCCSWVQEFINYQVPEKEKKEKEDPAAPKYLGGLDILMDYFVNMDDEGR